MKTKGRVEKALRALVESLPSLESIASYLLRIPFPASVSLEAGTRRKRERLKTGLIAAALLLAGVGSVRADGVIWVNGATGGEAIPANTAGGAWTTLMGPAITNLQSDALSGSGTLVLAAPAGFEFNPNAIVTVLVTKVGGINSGTPSLATLPAVVTPTDLTVVITSQSTSLGSGACLLTFQNVQVRPTAGSPLASGYITQSGASSFQNIIHLSGDWGFLREVGGAPVGYVITGTNYSTAGSPISVTIQKVDEFGNPVNDSTTENLVFSGFGTIGTNAPSVNGSTDAFTTGIPVSFDSHGSATVTVVDYLAQTATLNVTDGTYTGGSGLAITIAPGPVSGLDISSSPVSVTYGSSFAVTVETTDAYGNPSTSGLGPNLPVDLALTSGAGTLEGTLTQDVGSGAGNGTATFPGLQITSAGNNDVLTVSGPGLTAGSVTFSVAPLTVTPVVLVANKIYDGSVNATIVGRSLAGALGGDDVSLGASGVASFADKRVGNGKPVTVTGLTLAGSTAGNYQLSTTSPTTAASILSRNLHVMAFPRIKVYDGTCAATVILSDDRVTGDALSLSYSLAAFADPSVGNGKLVQVTGINVGGIDAGNYIPNTSITAMGIIRPAGSTTSVSSSQYPIVEGSSVTFTATVSGAAPAVGQPSGNVQFYANGQALGSPVALSGSTASLTTSQLSAGSNTVSATYLGSTDFQGSSASMVQAVQLNITNLIILSIVPNSDGTATITCQGVPATEYVVQAAPSIEAPVAWQNFSTNTSGFIDGKWTVTDDMTQHSFQFFRAVKF
jgi:hypothetical protein